MRTRILSVLVFVVIIGSTTAWAQASRTWVSGNGDDANPCSYTAPCRTFSGAYNKTATGGLISVKDPGPYSGLLITKSITIDGGDNYASVLHNNTDGITVGFSGTDAFQNTVVLRGISFDSNQAGYGIFVGGTAVTNLHIEDSTFTREGAAVGMFPGAAGSSLHMTNVRISKTNARGIAVQGPAGNPVKLELNDVHVSQGGTQGLVLFGNTKGTIANSSFTDNQHGVSVDATSVFVTLSRTLLSQNSSNGLRNTVAGTTTLIDGCTIVSNGNGVSNVGSTVIGFGNNTIALNVNDVVGNAITTLTQP